MGRSDSSAAIDLESVSLSAEKLGGIERSEVSFAPGITLLTGRNATNRTSLLAAFGSVLGGTTASLKSDADEGGVTLGLDGETYSQTYTRIDGEVQVKGTPFVEEATLVDLFVALFEDNPARRAVERGDDLRDILMRPIDTEAIEARIAELQEERQAIDDEIATVEERRSKLPALEERRTELQADRDTIDDEVAELREDVAAFEADVEAAEAATDVVDELNDRRQELNTVQEQIEVKQVERDALREELDSLEAEQEAVAEYTEEDLDDCTQDLQSTRERKHELDDTIASLTTIVDFNADLLSDETAPPGIEPESEAVTAELPPDADREVVCWTCGTQVQHGAIGDRLADLRGVIEEKRATRDELDARIEELQERRQEIEQATDRRETLTRQRSETEEKVAARTEEIDELEGKADQLHEAISTLESEAANTQELRDNDLLEKYERLSDLQYERGQLQQQLDDISAEITDIEEPPAKQTLETQREEIQAELEDERTRIEDLETMAVDAFNEHMGELLEILAYENLARVWLETRHPEPRPGPGEPKTSFELHVIRDSRDGTGYQDDVTNLSESEREIIGLVVALAGYLTHEVYETVPFMLLDSVEAIDADRLATLIEYFATYAPFLIMAVLPEDAAALDDKYDRVSADMLAA